MSRVVAEVIVAAEVLLDGLQVLRVAGQAVEGRRREQVLVLGLVVRVLAGHDVLGVVEALALAVLLEVCEGADRSFLIFCCGGLHGLVVLLPVDARRHRHDRGEVRRRRLGDRADVPLRGLHLRHDETGEVLARNLVIDAAFRVLHLQHPVEFPCGLLQVFGACGIRLVSEHQIRGRLRAGDDVLAIITRIVPAAGDVDLLFRPVDDGRIHVAGGVRKSARDRLVELRAAALQVEHLERVLHELAVHVVADAELI